MICLSCGRTLKSISSREAGYGPVCYKKIFGTRLKTGSKSRDSSYSDIPYYDIPGQMTLDDYLQTKPEENEKELDAISTAEFFSVVQ